jgi:hypothetical protein
VALERWYLGPVMLLDVTAPSVTRHRIMFYLSYRQIVSVSRTTKCVVCKPPNAVLMLENR